jgi:hypothetical protein
MALYPGESDDLPSLGWTLGIGAALLSLLWFLPSSAPDEDDA